MRVSEYVRKANKSKVSVSFERWSNLKQYYASMYHFYLLKLYDLGYISDPTELDEKEIRKTLVELGIPDFKDNCGKIILSSEYTSFAICRHTGDEEVRGFLKLLYLVLKYREYTYELDKQYELNNEHFKLNLGIKNCSKVTTLSDIKYNKGVFCALVKDGYCLEEVNFRDVMFDLAMEELGIAKEDYCDGMFIKNMSHQHEVQFSKLILDGNVKPDGVYADKLIGWLQEHKWATSSFTNANNRGLYSFIYSERDTDVIDTFDRLTEQYADRLVVAYEDTLYLKKEVDYYNIPISFFVSLSSSVKKDNIITDYNALYGYSGEAYTYDYLLSEGIESVGIPIIVNVSGVETQAYDIYQLVTDYKQNSWFSTDDASFEFDEHFYCENSFPKGTIEYELLEAYKNGNRGIIHRIKAPEGGFKTIKNARKKVTKEIVRLNM